MGEKKGVSGKAGHDQSPTSGDDQDDRHKDGPLEPSAWNPL